MSTGTARQYKFKVNDQVFETEQPILTGAQVKALAQIDPSYQLFLEIPGESKADRQIGDTDQLNFAEPGIEKLYTVPPATFGSR